MVAVEVDGSTHFTQNQPYVPLGRTLWRWRLLAARGWRVVSVPYYRWARLQTLADKKQYLYLLLQVGATVLPVVSYLLPGQQASVTPCTSAALGRSPAFLPTLLCLLFLCRLPCRSVRACGTASAWTPRTEMLLSSRPPTWRTSPLRVSRLCCVLCVLFSLQ